MKRHGRDDDVCRLICLSLHEDFLLRRAATALAQRFRFDRDRCRGTPTVLLTSLQPARVVGAQGRYDAICEFSAYARQAAKARRMPLASRRVCDLRAKPRRHSR